MYRFRQAAQKFLTFIALASILTQSLSPYMYVLPRVAYAQEATPTPADSPTPTDTVAPTPTDTVAPTPTDTITPTPTDSVTPTDVPQETVTPVPTDSPTTAPTDQVNNNSPPSNENNSSNESSTPTVTSEPSPASNAADATQEGDLSIAILDNTSAPSIDLNSYEAQGSASLTTDKTDYAPTDTALITGSNLTPNTTYNLTISSDDPPATSTTVQVTSNESGVFTYAYQLDGNYRPNYKVVLTDLSGNVVATTTFTDGPLGKDFKQCANQDPTLDSCHWIGSALQNTNSEYSEGMSVPQRLLLTDIPATAGNVHTLTLKHQATKGGVHAYDFLTAYNQGNTPPLTLNPCNDFGGSDGATCTSLRGGSNISVVSAPDDPYISKDGSTQSRINAYETAFGNRTITVYGSAAISAASFSSISHDVANSGDTGDSYVLYTLTWTSSSSNILIEMAGHLSLSVDSGIGWGANLGAGSVSGGPYHFKLDQLDSNSLGAQDNQIQAGAIIPPGSITVIKDAQPNDPQDFSFTTTGTGLSSFSLDDDSDSTLSNTKIFTGLDAGSYSVAETLEAGWTLSSKTCQSDGTGSTFGQITNGVSVSLVAGENVICTFTNTLQETHLTLVKTITNDNGGSALATAWTLSASGPTPISGATGDSSVTNALVSAGTYTLSESGGPSGYTAGDWSCVKNNNAPVTGSSITLAPGDNATCTINNNDIQPKLTVTKVVINDNGGTKIVADFPLFVGATSVTSGVQNGFNAGTYTVSETNQTGYTGAISGDCASNGSITLAAGDVKACTITNDDNAPELHLRKTVTNDNGGNALVTDWTLSATGTGGSQTNLSGTTPVDSGATFKADTYALAESGGPSGYTAGAWDCGQATMTDASHVTVPLGGNVTCTINNDDQQAYITVVKVVTNDNGGDALPDDFNLVLEGNPVSSGVQVPVSPGTYTAGETLLPGYTFEGFSGECDSNGDVTVALGESKTCTLTNNDNQSYIIVDKTVVNDNGGTAQPNDFLLTVDGNAVSDGVAYPVNPGAHTAGETLLPGYIAGAWGGDCNVNAGVTVALGQTKTCTITNDDQQAYITVVKSVTKDNGGTALPDDFNLTLEGNAVLSGVAVAVNPGSYTAAEVNLPGYTFEGFSGDCDSNGDVTVALGESKTCTLSNNDDAPSLTLIKEVTNDDGGQSAASAWTLSASGPTGFSGAGPTVNNGASFDAGTYNLSESGPTGYTASDWVCVGGNQTDGDTVVIGLGDNVTCTITNDDNAPTLKLVKSVRNNDGGNAVAGDWTLYATGDGGFNDVGDSTTFHPVKANEAYALSESGPSGYTQGAWVCNGGDQDGNSVTLGLDEDVTCTVTNDDDAPTITLIKDVINNNGGTAGENDFGLSVDGNSVDSGDTTSVDANTPIIIDEDGLFGYEFVSITGNAKCPSLLGGTATLDEGEDITCTITNDDVAPRLIVKKHVINDNGGSAVASDFSMFVTATNADPALFGGDEDGVTVTLDAGSYTVGEIGVSGYADSYSNDCSGTIAVGETKTCTVTNDDQTGSISGLKWNDENADGIMDSESGLELWSIQLFQDNDGVLGSQVGSDELTDADGEYIFDNIDAGSYFLCEVLQDGWAQTFPSVGDGAVEIQDHGNCYSLTLENGQKLSGFDFGNQGRGTIKVVKDVDTDGDGEVDQPNVSTWTWDLDGGDQNFETGSAPQDVAAGTHTVSEDQKDNYHITSVSCNNDEFSRDPSESIGVSVAPGEDVVCTFTNTRDTETITVHKQVDSDGDNQFEGGDAVANRLGFRWGLDGGTADREMGTSADITTGFPKHDVGENDVPGYTYVGWFEGNEESDFSCNNPESTDFPNFSVTNGNPRSIVLCNQRLDPILTITKENNTGGATLTPGSEVLYTIKVSLNEEGGAANDVKVTDLLPDGFKYKGGSWTATSNVNPGLSVPEPTYASPGVWSLGNMVPGETITLTLLATISNDQHLGLYKDVAWAQGNSLAGETILAIADSPGDLNLSDPSSNFVGTQVNIDKGGTESVGLSVRRGEVLGASTELPATGANSIWTLASIIALIAGLNLLAIGIIIRKRYV